MSKFLSECVYEYIKYLFLDETIGDCTICENENVVLKTIPCSNNHIICENCIEKVDKCPFCRCELISSDSFPSFSIYDAMSYRRDPYTPPSSSDNMYVS